MNQEGTFPGGGPGNRMGDDAMGSSMNEPAEWPRTMDQTKGRGWMPKMIAAIGSIATVIGAALFARSRSRKRSGLKVAMPSQLAEASEMVRNRSKNGGGPLRTALGVIAFALAGWGIRRAFSHQA